MSSIEPIGLTSRQIQNFIDDGFVRIESAFSAELAKHCRDELWAELGLSPHEPEAWTQPVVRIAAKSSRPFIEAANTASLHRAYDQLVGEGRWLEPKGLGKAGTHRSAPRTETLRPTLVLIAREGSRPSRRESSPDRTRDVRAMPRTRARR